MRCATFVQGPEAPPNIGHYCPTTYGLYPSHYNNASMYFGECRTKEQPSSTILTRKKIVAPRGIDSQGCPSSGARDI